MIWITNTYVYVSSNKQAYKLLREYVHPVTKMWEKILKKRHRFKLFNMSTPADEPETTNQSMNLHCDISLDKLDNQFILLGPLLLTWFNFNPSMDK